MTVLYIILNSCALSNLHSVLLVVQLSFGPLDSNDMLPLQRLEPRIDSAKQILLGLDSIEILLVAH